MADGVYRRADPIDNLKGSMPTEPVTRSVPSMGRAATPSTPDTSYGASIANSVAKFTSGKLREAQKKRQEQSMLDGKIAAMQGDSFESVEMEGDKWALEGYRVVTAQTLSAGLLRSQEQEIASGAYESDPDAYRERLVGRIDGMTANIEDERTRKLAQENLMKQMPTLVDAHMKQNLAFKEQQNFDALAASVGTLSENLNSSKELVAFATGASEATAGLSQSRRKSAVTQGVIDSFQNGNPKAYAHLEQAGFFTTENLTTQQLQQIESAKSNFQRKLRGEYNGQFKKEMTQLDDRIAKGELNPLAAAEETAKLMAKHGIEMSATEGNQIYDRARAGVELTEGTRGLNIQAAGTSGDYALQAELMKAAVIHQESRGNPNAVSPVGATGLMQLMPDTAMDPGYKVRNIFEHARALGVPVMAETRQVAKNLMLNPTVNEAMGTEYLTAMLKEYGGDHVRALVAYNWGPGKADNWNGDIATLPTETQGYLKNILGTISDNRPDPQAARVAAETRLKEARKNAALTTLENIGPDMAMNDEMFKAGEKDVSTWRAERDAILGQWNAALTSERINQEQAMLSSRAASDISSLQAQNDGVKAVALEAGVAKADVVREERMNKFERGEGTMTYEQIQQEHIGSVVDAYTQAGVDVDTAAIADVVGSSIRESTASVKKALDAQADNAIIANAEGSQSGSTLEPRLQKIMTDRAMKSIEQDVMNYSAQNPNIGLPQIAAMQRQMEAEWYGEQGIVDQGLKAIVNQAATGNWFNADGTPRPAVLAGVHSFVTLMSTDPALAYQYVPDAKARGRMLAANQQITSRFPDQQSFAQVDLTNKNDPIAATMFEVVQSIGLSLEKPYTPEELEIASSNVLAETKPSWFSFAGLRSNSAVRNMVGPGDSSTDNIYRNSIDYDTAGHDYNRAIENFVETSLPYMGDTSTSGVAEAARKYVSDRGAIVSGSFLMPRDGEPSIKQQVFPGQTGVSNEAVNNAVVGWLYDEATAVDNPYVKRFQEETSGLLGTSITSFTVRKVNDLYVADTVAGPIPLPMEDIGTRYIANR